MSQNPLSALKMATMTRAVVALIALFSAASAGTTTAANADIVSDDIGVLDKKNSVGPFRICPDDVADGFSIRCDGKNVNAFCQVLLHGLHGHSPYADQE